MAVDRVNTLYHLTPRGWIEGSTDFMWGENSTIEPPADRVETWEHEIYQSSGYSPEEPSWDMVWSSASILVEPGPNVDFSRVWPSLNSQATAIGVSQVESG